MCLRHDHPGCAPPAYGWYVLPGGTRRYEVLLPAADCPKVRSLGIEVLTTRATLTERVDAPVGACTP